MSKKIVVLGAGLVGKAIAEDLHHNYSVIACDKNPDYLEPLKKKGIQTRLTDLSDHSSMMKQMQEADLVVGALPGFMGMETIRTAIECGKDMVDISFLPEDPSELDQDAQKKKVSIIYDCGVAPGMGNIILASHSRSMEITDYKCYVGGLPVAREWPWEYKAVFSPVDVIEEYIRPARYVVNGEMVIREALSDPELIRFEKIGTLEAWNSDGLRSLMKSFNIPNMIEKTLRYPGTIEYLRVLREAGFFSYEEVEVRGIRVRPIDLTARLLFPQWQLKPGEEEFTVMRIMISGKEKGTSRTIEYNLFDRYDHASKTTSMARTTGYTCNAAVNLILQGGFAQKGVLPPESLGFEQKNFSFILSYLKERGVLYDVKISDQ